MAKKETKAEAKTKEKPKCKNCDFRLRNLCHRFPPKGDAGSRDGFPRIKEDDWCGEHKFVEEEASEPEQDQE